MDRPDVYKLIDGERDYQDTNRPCINKGIEDKEHSVGDWLLFIERHLTAGKNRHYELNDNAAMGQIRRMAALCVAAMENKDTPSRKV